VTEGPSARQIEILRLVAQGLSNPEIAKKLFVSTYTVKTHLRKLYKATGAKNAPHAVAMGFVKGWFGRPW
jgi:DNA-binding CsgD family transcriptional regulator